MNSSVTDRKPLVPKRRKNESLTSWLDRTADRAIEDRRLVDAFFLVEVVERINKMEKVDHDG